MTYTTIMIMVFSTKHFSCSRNHNSLAFKGEVLFSSKFYDTNMVDIWRDYEANMNVSSVWWSCIYAAENHTAIQHESAAMSNPDKPSVVPAVAWWKAGKHAFAVYEYPSGELIDVHNVKNLGSVDYDSSIYNGWGAMHAPSHEQYDKQGNVWSVVALQRKKPDHDAFQELKRVITKLNPETMERRVVAEYPYDDIDLRKKDTKIFDCKLSSTYFLVPASLYTCMLYSCYGFFIHDLTS